MIRQSFRRLYGNAVVLANIAYGEREREVIRKTCGRALKYREVYISPRSTRAKVWNFYRQMTFIPVRPGRLVLPVSGRVQDIIHQRDGTFIHPDSVLRVFKGREGVVQYQLIQHELGLFELKLVTVDEITYQRIIGKVLVDLRKLLGNSVTIDSSCCDELQRHKGGKFRPVISEVRSEMFKLRS